MIVVIGDRADARMASLFPFFRSSFYERHKLYHNISVLKSNQGWPHMVVRIRHDKLYAVRGVNVDARIFDRLRRRLVIIPLDAERRARFVSDPECNPDDREPNDADESQRRFALVGTLF